MSPRFRNTALLALTLGAALALLPASASAQAGLTWGDPYATPQEKVARNSQFDNGTLGGQSALGQLEEMTGATVDRSATETTAPRVAPRPKPRLTANQEIGVMVTGMLLDAVFADLFSDNSAQERAAAEAAAAAQAAAAAAAEAFRVQQELARKARIHLAQQYRVEWDDRETTIENQLNGAFDVRAGTSFFGMPANPDAGAIADILSQDFGGSAALPGETPDSWANDSSVVDLRDSLLIVQPLRPSTPAIPGHVGSMRRPPTHWAYDVPEDGDVLAPADRPPEHARQLAGYFGDYLSDHYLEDLPERYATAALWNALKNVPLIDKVKAFYDFGSKVQDLREEIGGWYGGLIDVGMGGAVDAVGVLGSPRGRSDAYAESYDRRYAEGTSGLQAKIYRLVHGEIADHFEVELENLEPVHGAGNMVPINGVPDAYQTHMRLSLLGSGQR